MKESAADVSTFGLPARGARRLSCALIQIALFLETTMDQIATPTHPSTPSAPPPRFAFVQAGWHADVVGRGRDGFLQEMQRRAPEAIVDLYDAPGAFETPLIAKRLALSGRYDAIAVCAFIVDGGVYRHDFVAGAVIDGLMRVGLDTDVPVLSVALTPHQFFHEQAAHAAFFRDHFLVKGAEAARAALAATELARQLAA
jgi:6,7-dimethyl-8-ribityllumazine synthase